MLLSQMTWPQVEEYLKTNNTILIPIGSTEQHGPTGIIGTDFVTSESIAKEVGQRQQIMVAPPICYGMALHHMGFAGTASLKPATFISLVCEIVDSFYQHGFKRIFLINGHGGNIAPITTAFCELKATKNDAQLYLRNWWTLKEVQEYEKQHFAEANGYHATCGEISVTQYLFPETFAAIPKQDFDAKCPPHHWPLSPYEFRQTFPDGRIASNPGLANTEHGKILFERAVDSIGLELQA